MFLKYSLAPLMGFLELSCESKTHNLLAILAAHFFVVVTTVIHLNGDDGVWRYAKWILNVLWWVLLLLLLKTTGILDYFDCIRSTQIRYFFSIHFWSRGAKEKFFAIAYVSCLQFLSNDIHFQRLIWTSNWRQHQQQQQQRLHIFPFGFCNSQIQWKIREKLNNNVRTANGCRRFASSRLETNLKTLFKFWMQQLTKKK